MFKLKLVENWRKAYKFLSVQLYVLLAALVASYDYLPVVAQYFPPEMIPFLAIAIVVARIIDQPKVK